MGELRVDQLVTDETCGNDVLRERTLEVADGAVDQELRVGRVLEVRGGHATRRVLIEDFAGVVARAGQRETGEGRRHALRADDGADTM